LNQPDQYDLFGSASPSVSNTVDPAPVSADVHDIARRLPSTIRLGTSSWSFPGWAGIVYTGRSDKQRLARAGLEAYACHPLLRAVGIDRGFYAPVMATAFASYASMVPDDFYFVVKAHHLCTSPLTLSFDGRPRTRNTNFLAPDFALEHVAEPLCNGLGTARVSLLLQFSPMSRYLSVDERAEFPDRLCRFLMALPEALAVAVELRDPALFTADYLCALDTAGATHCINIHPRGASLAAQIALARTGGNAPTVVRWMLGNGLAYEAAKQRYQPFDRLVDPDSRTRARVAQHCAALHQAGGRCVVIANNKAEGSAPLTLVELARAIVSQAVDH